jgi:RNA polymerase sigma factor (sigma-70 family)
MSVSKADFFRIPARLDERTFEGIFTDYYAQVYTILFRLTGDQYEADDLTAETFWRLWEHPPAQQENIGGWLYRVATHLGYNALRASKRREQYENAALGGSHDWAGADQEDPEHETELRQERERVRVILRKMPLRDVQVLVLRHSGLPYKEIAAAVDVSAGSIGTLLARAEAKFEILYQQGEKNAPE